MGAPQIDIVQSIVRAWKIVASAVIAGAIIGVLVGFIRPPVYRAQVSILPEGTSTNQLGSLGRLASSLDPALGKGSSLEPLYPEILSSNAIADKLLATEFSCEDCNQPRVLSQILAPKQDVPVTTLRDRVGKSILKTKRDELSGFIVVSASVRGDPELASQLANQAVAYLDEFVSDYHKRKAARKRQFLDQQVAEAESSLTLAENALTQFSARNRAINESPELRTQHERLSRREDFQHQIWLQLRLQFESARTEEENDSRGLVVLDDAALPVVNRPQQLFIHCLAGGMLGMIAALAALWIGMLLTAARDR